MEITNGVSLQVQRTDNDIGISIRFMAPLNRETAALRSMLAIMMSDRCQAYPSKKAMSDIQDMLYGLSLGAQTVGYGKSQVLELRCKLIDPLYVKEEDLLAQLFAYMEQIIFHPLLHEETLTEAKAILISKLQRIKDDPSQYAMMRGLQLGGEGDALGISSLGDSDIVEQVSLAQIKKTYEALLKENRIDVIVCGNVEEAQIRQLVKQYLPFEPRTYKQGTYYLFHRDNPLGIIRETKVIHQCSIFMLWETNTSICDKDYYALRLANAMLGQYPTSLLFQEVREKRSLCYSIYSSLISFDGALGVTTGVEQANIEEAIRLIQEQFQCIADGRFANDLLNISRTMTINSLRASKDAMNSLIAEAYQNNILNQSLNVDERIALFEQVTREDIQRVFAQCRHLLSFVVCGEVEA